MVRRKVWAAACMAVASVFATTGCTAADSTSPHVTPPVPADTALRLVALGDSISTATACPGCRTFVDLYGQAMARALGRKVEVQNLSVPGATSNDLLNRLLSDADTRAAVAQADILTVTIGFNDTPWGRIDDPCQVAPHFPRVRWGGITDGCISGVTHEYRSWLTKILAAVAEIRGEQPGLLRVTTVYNSVIGDHADPGWDSVEAIAPSVKAITAFARVECRLAQKYGGLCADLMHALNGPTAMLDAQPYLADHTHLNQHGHRLAARVLTQLGE